MKLELKSLYLLLYKPFFELHHEKSPNEFALKATIEKLNEIRLSEGEAKDSIMSQ